MTSRLLILLVCLAIQGATRAQDTVFQTLPAGYETRQGRLPALDPFSTASTSRWQWHHDSEQFMARGAILIDEIWVRLHDPNSAIPSTVRDQVRVSLATATTDYRVASRLPTFDQNVSGRQVVRDGRWTTSSEPPPLVPSRGWIPLGLSSSFIYDPTSGDDLVIGLEVCAAGTGSLLPPIDLALGPPGALGGNAYGVTGSCNASAPSTNGGDEVPIVRIAFQPLTSVPFAENRPGAKLTLDEVNAGPYEAAITSRCTGAFSHVAIASNLVGSTLDLALSPGPLLGAYDGGALTAGGQIVNLNPASSQLSFLSGGPTANFGLFPVQPFPYNFQIRTPPGTLSAQLAVVDPSHPDGVTLSQGVQLEGTAGGSALVLSLGDDEMATVDLGAAPHCGPAAFTFYGQPWTRCFVTSNGRITFDVPYVEPVPTLARARFGPPMIGAWTDLASSIGSGSIVIDSPTPDEQRFRWLNIPSAAGGPGNSLVLTLDANNDGIAIDWRAYGGPGRPAQPMFTGISPGYLGPATDSGQVFFAGPRLITQRPTDMLYQFTDLSSGVSFRNGTRFFPLAGGGYEAQPF